MCKKVLAVFLAAVMMLAMITVSASAAEFKDTTNHWAESAIDRWSDYGVVSGYNGAFRPNSNMTRGEFAQTMTTLLGLSEKAPNTFSDLKGTEWYADAVLKCRAAGIMVGTNGKSNATSRISRQEAFVMLGRALGIQPTSSTAALSKFKDAKGISAYAKPMLAAMVDAGYIAGVGGNSMKPASSINRASVMQILNATVTTYITEPGTYTVEDDGIVVVNTDGKVLITGDADGVVVAQGAEGADVSISGAVVDGNVKVDAADSTVTFNGAKADTVTVTDSADNAQIIVNAGSTVDTVTTSADGVSVSGGGEVKEVEVEDGDKVVVSTPGTEVNVDSGAGTVTAGGQTVTPGSEATTEGEGVGYVGNTDTSGGASGPSSTASTVTFQVASEALEWPNEPPLASMQVTSYTPDPSNPTTIKASGILTLARNFTGFNGSDTTEQNGWYAAVSITVPNSALTVDDPIVTLGGTPEKTFAGILFAQYNTNTLTVYQLVTKESNSSVKKSFTITVDWDGAGTSYTPTTYTIDYSDVVLSTGANHTVSYNMQGHGAAITSHTVVDGHTFSAPDPAPTAAGWTFGGWYTESACTNAWNFETGRVTGDLNLFAKWTQNPATITYVANYTPESGTIENVTAQKAVGSNYTIADVPASFAREGYVFKGWSNVPGATQHVATYNVGKTYSTDADLTLYAVWVQPVGTFDAFMLTGSMSKAEVLTKLQTYFPSLTAEAYASVYGDKPYTDYPWLFIVFKAGENTSNYTASKAKLTDFTFKVGETTLTPKFSTTADANKAVAGYSNNISFYIDETGAGDAANCESLQYKGPSATITVTLTVDGVTYTKDVAYTRELS